MTFVQCQTCKLLAHCRFDNILLDKAHACNFEVFCISFQAIICCFFLSRSLGMPNLFNKARILNYSCLFVLLFHKRTIKDPTRTVSLCSTVLPGDSIRHAFIVLPNLRDVTIRKQADLETKQSTLKEAPFFNCFMEFRKSL